MNRMPVMFDSTAVMVSARVLTFKPVRSPLNVELK